MIHTYRKVGNSHEVHYLMCKLACNVTPTPRQSLVCVPAENDKPASDVHT